MSLSVGIIGLPNVGKSTLFNALLKKQVAAISNYPFCTLKPNEGIVPVPDKRLEELARCLNLPQKIPAVIKFVDIAGLVQGAHRGEGLGNEFLSHIRECDCLVEVVRFFADPQIAGKVNPYNDMEIIKTELLLKDLETINKYLAKLKKEAKSGSKEREEELTLLERIKEGLEKGISLLELNLTAKEKDLIASLQLLSIKPIILVANVSEKDLYHKYQEFLKKGFLPIAAKLENELNELPPSEAEAYLKELGLKESFLNRLIKKAYETLGLITFYTLIPQKQIQAWPVLEGTKAPAAGGIIHSDFEEKFIAAEVIDWQSLIEAGSWSKAKERGKIRTEGKDYIISDGDVVYFKT